MQVVESLQASDEGVHSIKAFDCGVESLQAIRSKTRSRSKMF